MGIKQTLLDCIPDAYYSDGTKANCVMYKICNMFDIDKQSYVENKKKIGFSNESSDSIIGDKPKNTEKS